MTHRLPRPYVSCVVILTVSRFSLCDDQVSFLEKLGGGAARGFLPREALLVRHFCSRDAHDGVTRVVEICQICRSVDIVYVATVDRSSKESACLASSDIKKGPYFVKLS